MCLSRLSGSSDHFNIAVVRDSRRGSLILSVSAFNFLRTPVFLHLPIQLLLRLPRSSIDSRLSSFSISASVLSISPSAIVTTSRASRFSERASPPWASGPTSPSPAAARRGHVAIHPFWRRFAGVGTSRSVWTTAPAPSSITTVIWLLNTIEEAPTRLDSCIKGISGGDCSPSTSEVIGRCSW